MGGNIDSIQKLKNIYDKQHKKLAEQEIICKSLTLYISEMLSSFYNIFTINSDIVGKANSELLTSSKQKSNVRWIEKKLLQDTLGLKNFQVKGLANCGAYENYGWYVDFINEENDNKFYRLFVPNYKGINAENLCYANYGQYVLIECESFNVSRERICVSYSLKDIKETLKNTINNKM